LLLWEYAAIILECVNKNSVLAHVGGGCQKHWAAAIAPYIVIDV
jgi:hypothetical protein